MVTISDYAEREGRDGKKFYALIVLAGQPNRTLKLTKPPEINVNQAVLFLTPP